MAHSCESQLLITLDDLCVSLGKKIQTYVRILQFSRSFDTVPHERMVWTLWYSRRHVQLDRAFLTRRSVRVVVNGESSQLTTVLSGVPEETVLGPLLFLIYINDMPSQISEGTYNRLFADDCLVYQRIQSVNGQTILQQDLDSLHNWVLLWVCMTFDPSKCYIMHVARGHRLDKFYQMCGTILGTVTQAKYIGVTISDDLHEALVPACTPFSVAAISTRDLSRIRYRNRYRVYCIPYVYCTPTSCASLVNEKTNLGAHGTNCRCFKWKLM